MYHILCACCVMEVKKFATQRILCVYREKLAPQNCKKCPQRVCAFQTIAMLKICSTWKTNQTRSLSHQKSAKMSPLLKDQCSVPGFFCPFRKKSGNCHHPPDLHKKSCDKRKWKIVDGKSQMLIEGEPRSAGTQTTTPSFQRKLVLKIAL